MQYVRVHRRLCISRRVAAVDGVPRGGAEVPTKITPTIPPRHVYSSKSCACACPPSRRPSRHRSPWRPPRMRCLCKHIKIGTDHFVACSRLDSSTCAPHPPRCRSRRRCRRRCPDLPQRRRQTETLALQPRSLFITTHTRVPPPLCHSWRRRRRLHPPRRRRMADEASGGRHHLVAYFQYIL